MTEAIHKWVITIISFSIEWTLRKKGLTAYIYDDDSGYMTIFICNDAIILIGIFYSGCMWKYPFITDDWFSVLFHLCMFR